MDYRVILKNQLAMRKLVNSKFSLRSLAAKIELSPSKLSEVISGKKSLSAKRSEIIADKLGLRDLEREIFTLSAELEHGELNSATHAKLKLILAEHNNQKSCQHNAWYFGAVKAIHEEALDPMSFCENLVLTPLQIENAMRFIKRMARHYPERTKLSYEPTSVLKKLQDELLARSTDLNISFLFLTDADATAMEQDIQRIMRKYRLKSASKPQRKLRWTYFTQFSLTKKEQ